MSSTRTIDFDDGFTSGSAPALAGALIPLITGTLASPTAITAGGGISITGVQSEMIFIEGSGGPIDITADPQIENGTTTGQMLRLFGTSDTNTVTLESGTDVKLNGTIVLGLNSTIDLIWDSGSWNEVARRE